MKVGDKVKVIDSGFCYSSYYTFFKENNLVDLLGDNIFDYGIGATKGDAGIIIAIGKHCNGKDIYVVQCNSYNSVYPHKVVCLFEDKGLKAIEELYSIDELEEGVIYENSKSSELLTYVLCGKVLYRITINGKKEESSLPHNAVIRKIFKKVEV